MNHFNVAKGRPRTELALCGKAPWGNYFFEEEIAHKIFPHAVAYVLLKP